MLCNLGSTLKSHSESPQQKSSLVCFLSAKLRRLSLQNKLAPNLSHVLCFESVLSRAGQGGESKQRGRACVEEIKVCGVSCGDGIFSYNPFSMESNGHYACEKAKGL